MKVLKIIGIILLIVIVLIIVLGLVAPKDYAVERTVIINAPKDLVFDHVKYWRNWKQWSPWAERDSMMKVTIEGVDGDSSSIYKWIGDPDITGEGEMTNTGVKEGEEIAYHLHFIKPWESSSDGYLRVSEDSSGTKAAWGFSGTNPFPWNVLFLFMSMDNMIGKDFDRGLELLKTAAEKEEQAISSYEVKQVEWRKQLYAAIRKEIPFDQIQSFFSEAYGQIMQAIGSKGARSVGAPVGIYFKWDMQKMTSDLAAAIPVNRAVELGNVKSIELPAGTACVVDYYGPYAGIEPAHKALDRYIKQNMLIQNGPVIEEYITDPGAEPDTSNWLTRIYYFVE
ncbi:GyrI-like domain-containing protein [candidate division KSB1 bacterium]|nr:GyrI-like domain-containing protein [candidate division KSB1 bacterium]